MSLFLCLRLRMRRHRSLLAALAQLARSRPFACRDVCICSPLAANEVCDPGRRSPAPVAPARRRRRQPRAPDTPTAALGARSADGSPRRSQRRRRRSATAALSARTASQLFALEGMGVVSNLHYRANNLEADLDKVMREARRLLSDWELTEKELKGLEKRVQKLEDAVFGSTDSDDEIANRRPHKRRRVFEQEESLESEQEMEEAPPIVLEEQLVRVLAPRGTNRDAVPEGARWVLLWPKHKIAEAPTTPCGFGLSRPDPPAPPRRPLGAFPAQSSQRSHR